MKSLFFSSLLLISFSPLGQKDPVRRLWQVGLCASPDLTYRTIKNKSWSSPGLMLEDHLLFGYTVGANVHYQLKKQLGVEAGIQYTLMGYGSKGSPTLLSVHYGVLQLSTLTWRHAYLEIPLKITVQSKGKRIRFTGSVGIAPSFFTQERLQVVSTYMNGSRDTYTDKQPRFLFQLFPFASTGIAWQTTPRMYFKIEPTFRYSLFKMDAPAGGSGVRLWNAGMDVGCYYAL